MFYPIPSLGNKYEINKKGEVRNAITKRIKIPKAGTTSYHFVVNGIEVWACRSKLMAEVFSKQENFLPIHSLNCKYEIDIKGNVRHCKTKRYLKKIIHHSCAMVSLLNTEGKPNTYSIPQLLWEVWGKIPKKTNSPVTAIYLMKGEKHLFFPSIYKAAFFLAEKVFWCRDTIERRMYKRVSEIEGWRIFYREEGKRIIGRTNHGLGGRKLKNENN